MTKPYQVELLLKLLIGIIDAKLFKAVHIKCFKPEENVSLTLIIISSQWNINIR